MQSQILQEWMDHPVTAVLFKVIREHRDAGVNVLLNGNNDVPTRDKITGQVNAFDRITDIEEFLDADALKDLEEES